MIPQPGRMLWRYRLVEKIGEGGMGVVWKAFDTKLNRHVALKILPPELMADAERRSRFKREARAAAALNHPNIATVHEVGEAEGIIFIVMELVEGQTLRSMIRGKPLRLQDALRCAVEMAEGLVHAHQAGVIHRDLKPDNIIVRPDQHPKVLDFGLAKLLEEQEQIRRSRVSQVETRTAEMTREGKVLGTAAYMSPEQARGEAVDVRSDIFSLGVTLYEMVTGRVPFQGRNRAETLAAVLRDEAIPPSRLNADVPPELEQTLAKCLQKDPKRRYQHTDDLVVDLRRAGTIAEGSGVTAVPMPGRRARWLPLGLAGSLVALVAVVLASNVGLWKGRLLGRPGAGRIESLAVLPLENLSGDPQQEYFSDGMTEALITDLSKIRALRIISRISAMRYKETDKPLPEIAQELNVDAVVVGSVLRVGDRVRVTAQLVEAANDVHLWAESYERDLRDILALQSEVAQAIADEIHVVLTPQEKRHLAASRTVEPEAYHLYQKGRYFLNKRTEESVKKALEYFEQAIETDPGYALAYTGIADCHTIRGGSYLGLQEEEAYPRAKDAARKALELDETSAEAHAALAAVSWWEWEWSSAERELERALELNPGSAATHQNYAEHLSAMGRHEEAIAEALRARELDPFSLIINTVVGWTFYLARRYGEAIEQYRRTLELQPDFIVAQARLADAYWAKGVYEEAIAADQRLLGLMGASPEEAAALEQAYATSGAEGARRWWLETLKAESKQRSVPPYLFAQLHALLGEKDEAFRWLEEAYQARSYYLAYVNVDPFMDNLRSDSRLRDLARRVGIPPRRHGAGGGAVHAGREGDIGARVVGC